MKTEEFNKILESRITKLRNGLANKAKEYASGKKKDRLHNFHRAAESLRCTPPKALQGMMEKHVVSIKDIIDDIETDGILPSVEMLEEKIGDNIAYLVLLEAMVKEMI